ncbi:hypothetical protein [Posidoniimonas corsicana]|uniref:hypothetical protein n=1 Tax=Posidoniimonas corsicana TaxID=1938618 RepID=UPI0011B4D65E|nr:hypothetical protein [Posidoniimonas corsicana]
MLYGTRLGRGDRQQSPRERFFANQAPTWFSNRFTGLSLTDMGTGHEAFHSELINEVNLCDDRLGFEPELTTRMAKLGWRFAELPVSDTP